MSLVRGIITTFVLVASAEAFAIVPVCLHHGLNDLIQQARAFGPVDRRMELTEAAVKLKLSPAEVKQIRQTVGAFYCPPEPGFKESVGTAFLIGSNREIVTAEHLIKNDSGEQRDLSKCYFENFELPPVRKSLAAKSARNIIPQGARDKSNHTDDRVRLSLVEPLKGARPLEPDYSGTRLQKGDPLILLAAQNEDFQGTGKDPIVTPVEVEENAFDKDGIDMIYSAGDTDGGASGGVYLGRVNGKLVAKVMHVGGGSNLSEGKIPNHTPYQAGVNYSAGISITGEFLKWFPKK